jgi:hypothetical protein
MLQKPQRELGAACERVCATPYGHAYPRHQYRATAPSASIAHAFAGDH